jgi:hypothetical protein
MSRYHAPPDPACPRVAAFIASLFGDAMTKAQGVKMQNLFLLHLSLISGLSCRTTFNKELWTSIWPL